MKPEESVIKPKRPQGKGWRKLPSPEPWITNRYPAEQWFHDEMGISVISAVEVALDNDGVDVGPAFHVSMSKGIRCTSNEAKVVLKHFDMLDAEEDNHVPNGMVRNYWLPVNQNLIGSECPCKKTETPMKENKGDYIWRGINK